MRNEKIRKYFVEGLKAIWVLLNRLFVFIYAALYCYIPYYIYFNTNYFEKLNKYVSSWFLIIPLYGLMIIFFTLIGVIVIFFSIYKIGKLSLKIQIKFITLFIYKDKRNNLNLLEDYYKTEESISAFFRV